MNFDALAKQKVAGEDIWLLRDASLQLPPHCVYSGEHLSDLQCGYKLVVKTFKISTAERVPSECN